MVPGAQLGPQRVHPEPDCCPCLAQLPPAAGLLPGADNLPFPLQHCSGFGSVPNTCLVGQPARARPDKGELGIWNPGGGTQLGRGRG